jgi:hypothetical protein
MSGIDGDIGPNAVERPFGSAAGLPEPPGPTGPPERHGPTAPPEPAQRGLAIARRLPRPGWLLWLLVAAVVGLVMIVSSRSSGSDSSAIDRLQVGDCFEAPDTDLFTGSNIDEVSCDQPHSHEVYAIGTTTTRIGAGVDAEHNAEIIRICRTEVAPGILAALARIAGVSPGVIVDTTKPGRVVCTANTSPRSGSLLAGASAS